jgi:hypothetical protein
VSSVLEVTTSSGVGRARAFVVEARKTRKGTKIVSCIFNLL